jgi:hypothetical protein
MVDEQATSSTSADEQRISFNAHVHKEHHARDSKNACLISKITVRPREMGTGGTGVPYRMIDSSCARQRARSSTFIVSESLFPIRSHGEYYLKVPLRVLVEFSNPVSPLWCNMSTRVGGKEHVWS